jgi:hypothetical protein
VESMGGPPVAWRSGRTDSDDGATCPPDGRLPNADMGQAGQTVQHLRDIFHRMVRAGSTLLRPARAPLLCATRTPSPSPSPPALTCSGGWQGFTDKEMVALSGAHALGRCHTDRSGHVGPWTRAETTFSNEYYRGASMSSRLRTLGVSTARALEHLPAAHSRTNRESGSRLRGRAGAGSVGEREQAPWEASFVLGPPGSPPAPVAAVSVGAGQKCRIYRISVRE